MRSSACATALPPDVVILELPFNLMDKRYFTGKFEAKLQHEQHDDSGHWRIQLGVRRPANT